MLEKCKFCRDDWKGTIGTIKLYRQLQIKKEDVKRVLASLRHMEKVRDELRDGKRYIRLWD